MSEKEVWSSEKTYNMGFKDGMEYQRKELIEKVIGDLVKCLHPTCLEEYITETIKKYRKMVKGLEDRLPGGTGVEGR